MCVCVREREYVCVCVCERERECPIPQYLSDRSLGIERNVIRQVETGLVVSVIIIVSLSPEGC